MEEYDNEAAAGTIKIEDITSDEINQEILRRLKENDPNFDKLFVLSSRQLVIASLQPYCCYCPEGARDLGWLGYFIGKNTHLEELRFVSNPFEGVNIENFCRGVNRNRSIQRYLLNRIDLSGGEIFQSLLPFFRNNSNLSELSVCGCAFGDGCARHLSLVLRGCSSALKTIWFANNQMEDERLIEIIEASSIHPQLQKLVLSNMNIRRNECTTLGNLLRGPFTDLHLLNLSTNAIDDEGVDALVAGALANRLDSLHLSQNPNITATGYQSLATLLEYPQSNLEELYLMSNRVGDEGALIFANALASNCKLKTLNLYNNDITTEGWSGFSKVLCNTSSINNTFLSNHTLENLMVAHLPSDVKASLALNCSSEDKRQVAIKKILKHHHHFDMQPFFEWDLKVLPLAIAWLDRARSIEVTDEKVIFKQKLCAIYQFIRAMPEIFEPAPVHLMEGTDD